MIEIELAFVDSKKEKKRGRENEMLQREKKDEEKYDLLIQLVD